MRIEFVIKIYFSKQNVWKNNFQQAENYLNKFKFSNNSKNNNSMYFRYYLELKRLNISGLNKFISEGVFHQLSGKPFAMFRRISGKYLMVDRNKTGKSIGHKMGIIEVKSLENIELVERKNNRD